MTPDMMYWIESWKPGERPMFLTVEKVMVLRPVGVFSDVPEEVLAELASYLEEIEVAAEERVYEKGVIGRTMYIVADGFGTCTRTMPLQNWASANSSASWRPSIRSSIRLLSQPWTTRVCSDSTDQNKGRHRCVLRRGRRFR